jgi:hypothetical protein
MASKRILIWAAVALAAGAVTHGQPARRGENLQGGERSRPEANARTDVAEVRFKSFDAPSGRLTVDANGTGITLRAAGVVVEAAGQAINLDGLRPGTNVQLTYQHPPADGKLDIAQRCACNEACTATHVRLDYESGLWRNEFAFGVEFSQEHADFSEQDAVLNYRSDTLLWESPGRRWRTHLGFNIGLLTIPNEEAAKVAEEDGSSQPPGSRAKLQRESGPAAAEEDATTFDDFLASRKSLSLSIDLSVPRTWSLGGEDLLNLGLLLRGGLNTITDFEERSAPDPETTGAPPPGTEDTVNHFFNVGVRFAHHRRTSRGVNPEILRFMEVAYGYYENFFDEKQLASIGLEGEDSRRHRLVFNAQLRIPGSLPVFAGLRANVGRGSDDVRAHVALRFDFNRLAAIAAPDRDPEGTPRTGRLAGPPAPMRGAGAR